MSDVTGKDVVQALLKKPDLLRDTMAEITKVLGAWTQVPHPDNNEEGSVAFLRSNLSTGGDVVIVKTGFMGCWLWERVCGEGATPGHWGETMTKESAMEVADEWAKKQGYYVIPNE